MSNIKQAHTPLPDNWKWTTLGEIAKYINGRAFKPSEWENQGRPIIRIQNLTCSTNDINYYSKPVDEKYIVRNGDLLISWSATLGVYLYKGEEAVLNQHIFKVEPQINKMFLYYLTTAFLNSLKAQVHGSGMQHITKKKFEDTPVPLPPPDKQELIVLQIEELFSRLDAGVAGLKRAKAELERYRASVLKAAFEGRLVQQDPNDEPIIETLDTLGIKLLEPEIQSNLPVGWVNLYLRQIANVGTGATPLRSNKMYWEGGTIPWVKSGALNDGYVLQAEECITPIALEETNAKLVKAGSLLVAMYGEGKTRGKISELTFEAATNQAIASIEFSKENSIFKPYIKMYFQSYYDDLRRLASGGVQPNLNLSIIRNITIPLPPIMEQRRITEKLDSVISKIQKMEKSIDQSFSNADNLRATILNQAFKGVL